MYYPIESTVFVLRRLRVESSGFTDFYVKMVKEIYGVMKRMYLSLLLNRIGPNFIPLFLTTESFRTYYLKFMLVLLWAVVVSLFLVDCQDDPLLPILSIVGGTC